MAKVDRKTLDNIFNELNEEIQEEISELVHWDEDWTGYDVEPQDYYSHFDDHGDYDWRNDCFYGDY